MHLTHTAGCRWHNKEDWGALIRNGMTSDLSWDRAAQDYEQIFNWALMDPCSSLDSAFVALMLHILLVQA